MSKALLKNLKLKKEVCRKINPLLGNASVNQRTATIVKPTLTETEYQRSIQDELTHNKQETVYIPSTVSYEKRKLNKDKSQGKRSLSAKVIRWEHKEKLDPKDTEGCGTPVCVLIDSRPKRFQSLCSFARHLKNAELNRQFFQVQKGDCADASMCITVYTISKCTFKGNCTAVEQKGHDWHWGSKPTDGCQGCQGDKGCQTKICVAYNNEAITYASICDAMKALHDQRDTILIHFALGDCVDLLSPESKTKSILQLLFYRYFLLKTACIPNGLILMNLAKLVMLRVRHRIWLWQPIMSKLADIECVQRSDKLESLNSRP